MTPRELADKWRREANQYELDSGFDRRAEAAQAAVRLCADELEEMDGLIQLDPDDWKILLAAAKEGSISWVEWPYEDLHSSSDDATAIIEKVEEQLNG